ncbi:MAG: serine/threonine-protein kinase, partial [Acidobacteriota bacterium]
MTPETLGRYEILGELGKGAMGVVYLGRDPLIGRQLALKTFRLGYSAGDEELEQFRERFLREAQSAGILTHPNIVTIHDVAVEPGGDFFIAMEYVEGTDLKILMQRQRLDPKFAIEVVAQIADGLGFAHSKGVVHRDIKPANIIITSDQQAKITDFGIARVETSNLTMEGQLLGTPNYMSPEQIQGQAVDHRADIFSLGVMFYELLTGKKPFFGENLSAVTHRIVFGDFTPVDDLVPGLPTAWHSFESDHSALA